MTPWPVEAAVPEVHLPRPGHADLAGVQKYGFTDVRNACGDRHVLFAGLDDLALDPTAQNVPGTLDEHPNWQNKARYRLERIDADRDVRSPLKVIDSLRRGEAGRRPEQPL